MSSLESYRDARLIAAALGGVVAFAALPPYRLWALGTLPMLLLALVGVRARQSKVLLLVSYAFLAGYGLLLGKLFWRGSSLSEDGLLMGLLALPVIVFATVRVTLVERGEA